MASRADGLRSPGSARPARSATLALVLLVAPGVRAAEPPLLGAADVAVRVLSPTTFEVDERLVVETREATTLDHRLLLYDGTRVAAVLVSGDGVRAGQPRAAGSTLSLPIQIAGPGGHAYLVSYRVAQGEPWASRCPIWLPAASTDGMRRAVRLEVRLPAGATPLPDAFPSFDWTAEEGRVQLAHVPTIVRVAYAGLGEHVGWLDEFGRRSAVDLVAIVLLAAATLARGLRRRR
jgi:hypothetical protein